eukprot:CAMPEP_0197676838 /NCGR_PEP_ID=MMETSP1338-20131121/87460_1 /TAXON_ID=43686 ORGANISM="Pelagodinium beii, Strain RCC1491" /NCGR_SAMPLE_ID=MMETSP1338 /ASSEMBLY_ACC=CAM_ASM_000754 /LENGTH=69 /DNA_ID=CAMNT_0043257571 /DNA_START=393 /DNA_END=602 /DNA_ORIENTATION=-
MVDPVRNVQVSGLLVERAKKEGMAVRREVQVPRHFVHLDMAPDATTFTTVDTLPDALNVLVAIAEAVMA